MLLYTGQLEGGEALGDSGRAGQSLTWMDGRYLARYRPGAGSQSHQSITGGGRDGSLTGSHPSAPTQQYCLHPKQLAPQPRQRDSPWVRADL